MGSTRKRPLRFSGVGMKQTQTHNTMQKTNHDDRDAIFEVWQAMDSVRDAGLILKAQGKNTLYLDAAWKQLEAIAIELAL